MLTADFNCTSAPAAGTEFVDGVAPPSSACQAADSKPFDLQFVSISRREYVELKIQARQYQSLHARAVERQKWVQLRHDRELTEAREQVARLQAELLLARAQNRDLRQRVFGVKTEQSRSINVAPSGAGPAQQVSTRPRGQQRGRRGHGRTHLPGLPSVVDEVPGTISCPQCGAHAVAAWGTEDAQVLEIEVKAYRRVVRRQRYRPACRCGCLPGVVTAAAPQALWPRSKLGVSIWVELLLSKYLYGQPTARLLQDWTERGLPIAQGTVTDGLHRLAPLFEPMMDACLSELRRASHWHADETRWEVFEDLPGKTGHRWYLWVFKAQRAVCFVLDPSRSSAVPTKALQGAQGGILSVDRYAAYRKFARQVRGMSLALCWAHQRRDFLRVANDHPSLWDWAVQWVQRVGELYELHRARRALMHDTTSTPFIEADSKLRDHVALLQRQCDSELADLQLAGPARKVLRVLKSYWPGLVVFVEHPWLDLDNNAAERALRPAVVGRKNYYGSGSLWSGQLAAQVLSVLGTMRLWGVNPRTWLQAYLQACAHAGGKPPPDVHRFVPWHMSPAQLATLRRAPTTGARPATTRNTS
jgi:transposase